MAYSAFGINYDTAAKIAAYGGDAEIPAQLIWAEDTNQLWIVHGTEGKYRVAMADELSAYLTTANASATYLSKTDASKTYLTQANANATYLSKSDASATYLGIDAKAKTAGTADAVPWSGVSGKPSLAETNKVNQFVNKQLIQNSGESSPNEGGMFVLQKSTSTNLTDDVAFAVSGDTFRVHEVGGSQRGFRINLTKCKEGVGTWLVRSVNGVEADSTGNVQVGTGIQSVNGIRPDEGGNVSIPVSNKLPFLSWELITLNCRQTTITIEKNIVVSSYKSARDWGRSFTLPDGKVIDIHYGNIPLGTFIPKGTRWTVNKEEDTITGYEVLHMAEVLL